MSGSVVVFDGGDVFKVFLGSVGFHITFDRIDWCDAWFPMQSLINVEFVIRTEVEVAVDVNKTTKITVIA